MAFSVLMSPLGAIEQELAIHSFNMDLMRISQKELEEVRMGKQRREKTVLA